MVFTPDKRSFHRDSENDNIKLKNFTTVSPEDKIVCECIYMTFPPVSILICTGEMATVVLIYSLVLVSYRSGEMSVPHRDSRVLLTR